MDTNNWRPAQGGTEATMMTGDWRTQFQHDSRQRIVNKIVDTLKRHLPFSGEEGLQDLKKIAVRFEKEIYTAATSQSDYLRKISLKMLTMESKSQNTIPSSQPSDSATSEVSLMVQITCPWYLEFYMLNCYGYLCLLSTCMYSPLYPLPFLVVEFVLSCSCILVAIQGKVFIF